MTFEDEKLRIFFHTLRTDIQILAHERENEAHDKGKLVHLSEIFLHKDGQLELVLRIEDEVESLFTQA